MVPSARGVDFKVLAAFPVDARAFITGPLYSPKRSAQ
jgi:hypothetical protein